jgi:pimeloyl-ACP methyl ester carboxylesterase
MIGPVYPSDSIAEIFEKRIQVVEKEGMEPMANTIPAAATGKKASPIARAFIRELLLAQNPTGYISNCRVIANAKPPNYAKIAVPVLILAGEEDKSAPLEGCEKMFEQMGTGEKKMETLKGVGHWHCVEAFEEVGKQILSFYHEIQ